jgi:hypothetical protein
MNLDREEKPLEDAELEMVVQVIRRGLVTGNRIENLEERLGTMAAVLQEAKKRLLAMNRIGQELARSYQKAIDPQRKHPLTVAEAVERMKWIQEKSGELKAQLE